MADQIRNCADLDEHLAPFVDGEDPPAARASVAAHLAKCPPCQKHATDEAAARNLIHDHRDELRATAPEALRARCANLSSLSAAPVAPTKSFVRKWAPMSLAATIVLAVAAVFAFGLHNPVEALAASLAVDHVKCFKVGLTNSGSDPVVGAQKWQQDQGWAIVVPPPAATEQLQLVDVRRCFSTDGRAAHMMYTWRGAPLSLYVLPENTGHEQTLRKIGHDAVIWCANQRTYAVVADGPPRQDLTRIVEYFKAHAR
jgi:anti-sigma factor RsiW